MRCALHRIRDTAAMIEIREVSHRYAGRDGAGGYWALRNVSLAIESGTFVSLLGPSGCGKTTLLRIANGLIHPARGAVAIGGKRVTGPSADRAMVFQEFNLLPWRTARRNVEMPLEVLGVPPRRRREISAQRLAQVGLDKFADFYPHQLSGGMKQRVGLARALAIDPSYLFMDEPFGALDPQIREMMQIELMKLWDDGKAASRKTVLFVTHSVDEAVFLSDRVIMMGTQPGRVIADLAIDLPRPRWIDDEALKRSPAFIAYRNDIWHMLKQQLNQGSEIPAPMSGA
jgi:NitT/TauT family transport system ATP-binding protein